MRLIAVGMRYTSAAAQKFLRETPVNSKVILRLAENANGVQYQGRTLAVEVHAGGERIAYIRNQDLIQFLDYRTPGLTHYIALLREKRENWLTLEYSKETTSNPCKEIDMGGEFKQKESNIMNFNVRDQFFREVKNVAIDVQSGKFGVVTAEGIAVYDKGSINVNPIQELGVKIPAFALRIAVDALKEGDLILGEGDPVFFVKKTETGFETISTKGIRGEVGNVKNMFFGENTVLAVKNMFEGSGMNPMVMLMMAGEGKNGIDMKTIALMSMMNGGKGGFDPSMLMMLALAGK